MNRDDANAKRRLLTHLRASRPFFEQATAREIRLELIAQAVDGLTIDERASLWRDGIELADRKPATS